ncbi:MAG TPA: hypothetical protein VIY48_11175, partial [Candidatus Paceibacterota bacterium]
RWPRPDWTSVMTTGLSDEFKRRAEQNIQAERVHVVAQLADVRRRLATLKATERELSARARDLIPVGTKSAVFGSETVTVTQPQRFSATLATQVLSPEVLASISRTVIDPALAERNLSPALYDACKENYGTPQVRLGRN